MSETSNNTELFLKLMEGRRVSSKEKAERIIREELKNKVPKTVREYAEQQGISIQEARKELKDKGIQLGSLTSTTDITKGLPSITAANYDKEAGLEVLDDGTVVSKKRPKGFGRFASGVLDIFTAGFGDFDQQGGLFGGQTTGLGYNIESDKYTQKIRPAGTTSLLDSMVEEKMKNVNISPTGEVFSNEFDLSGASSGSSSGSSSDSGSGSVLEEYAKFEEKRNEQQRKERRKEALQDTAITTLQTPIYTRLIEDAAKRRLELDKAMLAAREMMPSNIQKIMKSKQEQANLAADAEYRRALGVAAQQDAATRFAGLGMQRQFG